VPLNTDVTYAETSRGLVFEMRDVLERVTEHGDLFAGVLTTTQAVRRPADGGPRAAAP